MSTADARRGHRRAVGPSSTRLLADRLAAATARRCAAAGIEAEVEVVELRELARDLADNLVTGFPNAELRAAIDTVTGADGLIAVTPIFAASYSGLFKTFFDVLDQDALGGHAGAARRDGRHRAALAGARLRACGRCSPTCAPSRCRPGCSRRRGLGRGGVGSVDAHRAGRARARRPRRGPPAARPADPFADVVPFEALLRVP